MSDVVSLRDYMDTRFAAQDRAVNAALSAAEKATTKAEVAAETRFQSVNEFRQTLTDQARTFLPRAEYESAHRAIGEKVEALQKIMWIGTGVVIAFQFLIGVLLVFWRKT